MLGNGAAVSVLMVGRPSAWDPAAPGGLGRGAGAWVAPSQSGSVRVYVRGGAAAVRVGFGVGDGEEGFA